MDHQIICVGTGVWACLGTGSYLLYLGYYPGWAGDGGKYFTSFRTGGRSDKNRLPHIILFQVVSDFPIEWDCGVDRQNIRPIDCEHSDS